MAFKIYASNQSQLEMQIFRSRVSVSTSLRRLSLIWVKFFYPPGTPGLRSTNKHHPKLPILLFSCQHDKRKASFDFKWRHQMKLLSSNWVGSRILRIPERKTTRNMTEGLFRDAASGISDNIYAQVVGPQQGPAWAGYGDGAGVGGLRTDTDALSVALQTPTLAWR